MNQLLDAFHLWSAEAAGCDYFLTLDFKLIKMMNQAPSSTPVRIVRPSELLIDFRTTSQP
jgi:predicted nucleic acid-binding protein